MALRVILGFTFLYLGLADLRWASQPKDSFTVKILSRRRTLPFNTSYALYMEPSDFGYAGLVEQRNRAYDNFLRSNIDNQQDRRNFETEIGRDHLPFRSYESASVDSHDTQQTKMTDEFPGNCLTVNPNELTMMPLRWNNPHAAELEVNVWIMQNKYVVKVMKPICSGEGYQDNINSFKIPEDFNALGTKVPGFAGCKAIGDCVLQVYAHSVESRTYASGVPLIVTGEVNPAPGDANAAENENQIQAACRDAGMDMSALRTLCLPSNDASRHIANAIPYYARLSSDQWCHAYMNSDYSPYHGQQCESISKNLQASTIISMVSGNRGELGKQALLMDNPAGFAFQRSLNRKQKKLVKQYENIADSLIDLVGDNMKEQDLNVGPARSQRMGCVEMGVRWNPLNMEGQERTSSNTVDCRKRCAGVTGCAHFASYPNGGCHIQNNEATKIQLPLAESRVISGEPTCNSEGGAMEEQITGNCFRCATVGSTTTRRLSQNTYIPSYQLPQNLLSAVDILIPVDSEYRNLINFQTGLVEIYVSVVNDLNEEFQKAAALNITMQTARIKPYEASTNPSQTALLGALKTHEDTTQFRKIDADGNTGDKGLYAAREAFKKYGYPPWRDVVVPPVPATQSTPLTAPLAEHVPYGTEIALPATAEGVTVVMAEVDPNGIMTDTICEDASNHNVSEIENCPPPSEYLFQLPEDIEATLANRGGQGQVVTGGASHNYSYLSALGLLSAAYLL